MNRSKERPFFIIGAGRSGTTLLRMVLSSHSRLSIPPETWFLLDLVRELPLHDELSREQVDRAVDLMVGHYRWPDFEMDPDALRTAAHSLEEPTVGSVASIVHDTIADREQRPRWGDKTPAYVRIVPQLAEVYPCAQFLHLVRDGRDVAKSCQDKGWYGRWLVWNASDWCEAIDHMRDYRELLGPERLLEVRYEDLVLQTEEVTRRICAFLGEDFEPSMLEWESAIREKVPERELQIHQKLFRKPRPQDIHRWRNELSAGRTFALESYIGSRLEEVGYERRYSGPAWRPALSAFEVLSRVTLPVAELGLRVAGGLKRRALRLLGGGAVGESQ